MKKIALAIAIMLAFSVFAMAEVTGVDAPALSGDVTLTFGYDLDHEASGFVNSSNVNVKVPLAAGDDTKAGEGNVYAEIKIKDIDLNVSEDDGLKTKAKVAAKVFVGPLYIGLGNPDMAFNNVDLDKDAVDVNVDTVNNSGGLSVGYASDMFSAEFLVGSVKDYRGDKDHKNAVVKDEDTNWLDSNKDDEADEKSFKPNKDHDYVFGANVTINPVTGVSIPLYFAYGKDYSGSDAIMGVGAAPSVAAGDLTLKIPADYVTVGDDNGMEVKPDLAYAITDIGSISANFLYAQYDLSSNKTKVMEAGLKFTEGFDDAYAMTLEGKIKGLDSDTDMSWTVDMDNSYDLGGIKPYVNFGYGEDEVFDLSVGVEMTAVVDMATVTLDYTSADLTSDAKEDGRITAAVKVTY